MWKEIIAKKTHRLTNACLAEVEDTGAKCHRRHTQEPWCSSRTILFSSQKVSPSEQKEQENCIEYQTRLGLSRTARIDHGPHYFAQCQLPSME